MKKFFTKSAEINFLMLLISYLVYPLSHILVKLKIKANLITFISLFLAIYASYQFILGNFKYFTILFKKFKINLNSQIIYYIIRFLTSS
jgi:hypothetical protein